MHCLYCITLFEDNSHGCPDVSHARFDLQNLAFYWGTSEWLPEQIIEAHNIAQRLGMVGPMAEQTHYNLLHRKRVEQDLVPLYDTCGIGLTTWSPLAGGVLTGKYRGKNVPEGSRFSVQRYQNLKEGLMTDTNLEAAEKLRPIAEELGVTMAQLALAWCMSNENVSTVITGATTMQQLEDNLKSVSVVSLLTEDVKARIEEAVGTNSCSILHRF